MRTKARTAGMAAGHELRDQATAGGADQHGTPDPDRVHEADNVGSEVLEAIAIRGGGRHHRARAALVHCRAATPEDARGHLDVPPRLDGGVYEHDWDACRVARLGVGNMKPARQGDSPTRHRPHGDAGGADPDWQAGR